MPFFCPVPRGVPKQPASHVPGDGPYYVASVATGRTVLLQNPNYGGSRPRRAARIVFESGTPTPQAVTLTDRGELDYLPPDFDSNSLLGVSGALDRRYGPASAAARAGDERYLHLPIPAEDGVVFNATRPLFRDVRVRRAVEYALDRRRLSASYADLPTDGIVPPAVPGFGRAHVYPLTPDLVTARRLAGHTRRRAVLYYCTNGPFGGTGHAHVAAIIRANLARIGISVSIVAPPCSADNRYDAHSRQADPSSPRRSVRSSIRRPFSRSCCRTVSSAPRSAAASGPSASSWRACVAPRPSREAPGARPTAGSSRNCSEPLRSQRSEASTTVIISRRTSAAASSRKVQT